MATRDRNHAFRDIEIVDAFQASDQPGQHGRVGAGQAQQSLCSGVSDPPILGTRQ